MLDASSPYQIKLNLFWLYLTSLIWAYWLNLDNLLVINNARKSPSLSYSAYSARQLSFTSSIFISSLSFYCQLQMSPSKPLRYGDLTLLQKLDEVGSSVKVEHQTSDFCFKSRVCSSFSQILLTSGIFYREFKHYLRSTLQHQNV